MTRPLSGAMVCLLAGRGPAAGRKGASMGEGYTLHVSDATRPLGTRTVEMPGATRADALRAAQSAGAPTLVWPKDQSDDGGHPLCLVHGNRALYIMRQIDSSPYLSPLWGGRCYPYGRADASLYDAFYGFAGATSGDLYRAARAQFGRCEGRGYRGGWVFVRTDRSYEPVKLRHYVRVGDLPENPAGEGA